MPRHWSLCFLVSPCYLQDIMPCQWSSSGRDCYGFERAFFYFSGAFSLHSFLLVLRLPWSRKFNLKVSRASCWSSKHSHGPTICLNHNNPQKGYGGRFFLWFTAGWLCEESAPYGIQTIFTTSRVVKSCTTYPFGHRAIQSVIN